jgi:DNA invertase Pin-like site-specific DNA recombinase
MTTSKPSAGNRPVKITLQHLERWALVYVRQSHRHQVLRHRESAEVQANLQQLALGWGWPSKRIRVLDGDQGFSGTSTVGREDFAWLLSEIALGHVGLVLGFQINRFAREDEDCCRLIRVCGAFDTLLADQDGLYHPHDFNDRLILTIKGFMGGFELHQFQQRMQAGRLNRARRGEWLGQPPPGYVIGPDHKLQFDPDEQVQTVIRLILDQFNYLGSISGLLRYLRQHEIEMPYRVPGGPNLGVLHWHRPHRETLRNLLRSPAYAGVYTWGRRAFDPRRQVPGHRGSGRVEREPQDCPVFLPDNHPAYCTREQHQENIRRLRQQRSRGPVPGPARQTVSLLAGLMVCGSCGSRMQTHYTRSLRYACQRHAIDYDAPACQSLVGEPLERLAAEQILQVVTPAGLELSLRAAEQREQERAALEKQWRLRLERVNQDTARAYRQYDAVEPEDRLVARALERKWDQALLAQRALEEDYDRFRQTEPKALTVAERTQIEALARDLPAVWHSPLTGVTEKRRVVRLLLERVVVWAPALSQEVTVHLHWSVGTVTEHRVMRPVGAWARVASAAAMREQAQAWRAAGWPSRRIAEELNAADYRTPRGKPLTAENVRQLLARGAYATATQTEAGGRSDARQSLPRPSAARKKGQKTRTKPKSQKRSAKVGATPRG